MSGKLKIKSLIILLYCLILVGLLGYSFSQIDLNLTLSSNPWYQTVQQKLIILGYFQRPASTSIYLCLILLLFLFQLYFIKEAKRGMLSENLVWRLSLVSAAILLFSYPAFSHDIFNYIFDTRLMVTHHVNPWKYTALDFPQDLWTRFMRWTHRTYPYGPTWLLITTPFYILGMGKFSLTLLSFKVLGSLSYLICIWAIRKILTLHSPKDASFSMVLFGLNPLIIIESLVSAHIDITMAALFLIAVLLGMKRRNISAWIVWVISGGIKFVTAFTFPAWLWWRGRKERAKNAMVLMFLLVSSATVVAVLSRELLPWYLVTPLAVSALLPRQRATLHVLLQTFTAGLLFRYAPYLLKGEYSAWVKTTREWVTFLPILGAAVCLWLRKKNFSLSSS